MAIKNVKFDDLDGSMLEPGDGGTVTFAFRGQVYELELSHANEEKFADLLGPYIEVARKRSTAAGSSIAAKEEASASTSYSQRDARKWLAANGHEPPVRGPLSTELLSVYEKAHGLAG